MKFQMDAASPKNGVLLRFVSDCSALSVLLKLKKDGMLGQDTYCQ